MKTKTLFASLITAPLLLTGCASILDGGPKTVQIHSNPEGAKVTISDRNGKSVYVRTTPTTVRLKRSSGFFEGEDYTLLFEKAGYYPYEAHVQSTLDGWYFGNVVFGGLIGLVFVDPATGDMFTLSPRQVNCNLISNQTLSSINIGTGNDVPSTNPSIPSSVRRHR